MTVCVWGGPRPRDRVVETPHWCDVEEAIRALNNNERNDLYLTPDKKDPETYLGIGGGNGRYLVTGSNRNETFPTLVLPHNPAKPVVEIVVGGQAAEYPANWIVSLDLALRAAKSFYDLAGFGSDFDDQAAWVDV